MSDFRYRRPKSLDEALRMLADEPEAKVLAGGQSLLPAMKQRLARPSMLVDLQELSELRGIEVDDRHVRVGAFTRHAEVASSARIADALPALVHMARGIAHPQVRHMGTLGGSIAHNDPGADYPAAVLGLGATLHTNRRAIPADGFFKGLFDTALEPGELIVRIDFPRYEASGYHKMPHPASGLVNTGAWVTRLSDGSVRVAVNGAAPCVFRSEDAERLLADRFEPAALDEWRPQADGLNADLHASAAYRANLIGVSVRRALAMALRH